MVYIFAVELLFYLIIEFTIDFILLVEEIINASLKIILGCMEEN
jgi:hypothetical protein